MMISINTPKEDMIRLAPACTCEACQHGCSYGSGVLADEDLKPMAKFLGISKEELKENYLEKIEKFSTTRLRPQILRKNKKDGQELPFGNCVFLDDKKMCKVHDAKPLECKVSSGCQSHSTDASHWFTLNYFVNKDDPESVRQWHQFLKNTNNETIVGGTLKELVPNKKKKERILKYDILK